LIPFLASQLNAQSLVPAEPCSKSSLSGRDAELSRTKLMTVTTLPFKMPDRTSSQKNLGLDELSRLAGCGKTRFEADAVPRNSLVSTAQPDKKKACVEKTSSSWMCLAT
jgi:hypothetical protein